LTRLFLVDTGGVDKNLDGEDDLGILYSVAYLEAVEIPIIRLKHREKGILLSDAACKGDKGDAIDRDRSRCELGK
jgi:hypothetical protein